MADVTQIDVADVEESLAEDLSEAHPYTNLPDVGRIGVQIPPSTDRGADECTSASLESCWGEMEDIGEEEVEWGAVPRPPSNGRQGWSP